MKILNVNEVTVQTPLEAIQILSDLQDLEETEAMVSVMDSETGEVLQVVEVNFNDRQEYGWGDLGPFQYTHSAEAPLQALLSSGKDGYLFM